MESIVRTFYVFNAPEYDIRKVTYIYEDGSMTIKDLQDLKSYSLIWSPITKGLHRFVHEEGNWKRVYSKDAPKQVLLGLTLVGANILS